LTDVLFGTVIAASTVAGISTLFSP